MLVYVDVLVLASRLDGLPLAIVMAGSFMRETGTSITEFLQYYQEAWFDLHLHNRVLDAITSKETSYRHGGSHIKRS
jgi:hypothetical protein